MRTKYVSVQALPSLVHPCKERHSHGYDLACLGTWVSTYEVVHLYMLEPSKIGTYLGMRDDARGSSSSPPRPTPPPPPSPSSTYNAAAIRNKDIAQQMHKAPNGHFSVHRSGGGI